ncbi:hypothetical protein IFM89_027402 [Coptis chinensis]|uniref:F-box domain-containing protein n=1 Tax=Coptis chinensis TaxID=261450 RepID=A0A835IDS9_9MAGN|nr:hypothetical protein IFM89_027402 [Coptis chinensis]
MVEGVRSHTSRMLKTSLKRDEVIRPIKAEERMSDLVPTPVVENILSRLPLDSIARCRYQKFLINSSFEGMIALRFWALVMVCHHSFVETWVMKNYGMKESWTKLFRIKRIRLLPSRLHMIGYHYASLIKEIMIPHREFNGIRDLYGEQ